VLQIFAKERQIRKSIIRVLKKESEAILSLLANLANVEIAKPLAAKPNITQSVLCQRMWKILEMIVEM
jgi:hypothetical protein